MTVNVLLQGRARLRVPMDMPIFALDMKLLIVKKMLASRKSIASRGTVSSRPTRGRVNLVVSVSLPVESVPCLVSNRFTSAFKIASKWVMIKIRLL